MARAKRAIPMGSNTRRIIIREHQHRSVEIISNVPDDVPAAQVVERWQKASIWYQVRGTLPPVTWKVAEPGSIIDAMIEGARL